MNRKAVSAVAGLGLLALVAGPAMAANTSNPGARKAQLLPQAPGNDPSKCNPGDPSTSQSALPNGFVIFNAPGQPGVTTNYEGEVSLKNADPNAVYTVYLQKGTNNNCTMVNALTTNGQGNGNAHISIVDLANAGITGGAGSYYVVLKEAAPQGPQPQFATQAVAIS